jgi:hypothetical protein
MIGVQLAWLQQLGLSGDPTAQQTSLRQPRCALLMSVPSAGMCRSDIVLQLHWQSGVALAYCVQAMANSCAEVRRECSSWQSQAQDSLVTISRLQELLTDAAASSSTPADAQQRASQPQPDGASESGAERPEAGTAVGALQASVRQHQLQVAALELQVKVLSMQLLRSHAAHKQASSAIMPVLSGTEARLLALKTRTSSLAV